MAEQRGVLKNLCYLVAWFTATADTQVSSVEEGLANLRNNFAEVRTGMSSASGVR